jgi:hypothetical protein
VQNEFIRSIHHKSWIIQIPCIPQRRRNDLEVLLSIFDQRKAFDNAHFLAVEDEYFPEEFRPIIRRLSVALQSDQIRANMEFEDNILFNIQAIEEEKDYIINKERAEKEKALAEIEIEREEKEKALEEKEIALAEIAELKRRLANQ